MKEFFKAIYKLAEHCVVKVLKANLNTDTYKILHLDKGESTCSSPILSDWVEDSCSKNLIHEDYIEVFRHIINIDYIRKNLRFKKYIHLKLKRRPFQNMDFKNTVITIVKADENNAYIIVYDIDE